MSIKAKAIRAAIRLAKRKKYTWRNQFKSQKTTPRVRGKKTEAKFKFKQKPKLRTLGGREQTTQVGSYFGPRGLEAKLHSPMLGIALKNPRFQRWPHGRESWRSEMERMYGGIHMSQDPKAIKKSIKLLTKKKHFKKIKIKKATEGGEVTISKNVDRSLL